MEMGGMEPVVQRKKEEDKFLDEFKRDCAIIGRQTVEYLHLVYPAYLVRDPGNIEEYLDNDKIDLLDNMTYFRIKCCTADNVDKIFETVNAKIEKLFCALHSIGLREEQGRTKPDILVGYGLVSSGGVTNLVLGVDSGAESVKNIMQGMLSGIEMEDYKPNFSESKQKNRSHGILSGVPSLYLREQKQTFSLSSIMRSLNGSDYTLLFLAMPVPAEKVTQNISDLINVRDKAFAVTKRNVARSNSYARTNTHTDSVSDSESSIFGSVIGGVVTAAGSIAGTLVAPGPGTVVGGAIGAGLGSLVGSLFSRKTHTEGYSDSISNAITEGSTVSGEIQNGFALELMNYADKAIERLKSGQNSGVWQTAIVYSADSANTRNIIKACLCGELSKPDPDKLPMLAFEPCPKDDAALRIPNFFYNNGNNPLCSCINSAELGLLCTFPTESVPDFEIRIAKEYPLARTAVNPDSMTIGNISDGKRALKNMPFTLSQLDLNKHMFVCGMTGSGKTTTVKKILKEANKPFLVIESAKMEYRNLSIDGTVYTPGKPEINCPQINPFYIMPGVSPQTHIDYLKDLFNASFSFYGPMPYILEKCLHTVYQNKGWDLTLGYHPLLSDNKSIVNLFDIQYTKRQYAKTAHKYLFPTMQELKDEIERYIEEDLKYDGEVAGNVKTAMKVRLENLCVGAKGFTFNTCECLDVSELLKENAVFELEGLADDSDKAFSVGLLVIFINEFRRIEKEIRGIKGTGLEHILVIEEAHRLLKNVDTERSTETMGNPKGKAVEHFTNMIAEMRSYGQGVIVAEQIPSKLAPDVIKNSSTKIVQRIVSADDQKIMANTIGILEEDALHLGTLEAGYAFCHKEGMARPAPVKILNTFTGENGREEQLDVFVPTGLLFNINESRFMDINLSTVRSTFGTDNKVIQKAYALLNTLFIESNEAGAAACKGTVDYFKTQLIQRCVTLTQCQDMEFLIAEYLTEILLSRMTRGIYCVGQLPSDEFVSVLKEALSYPTAENILWLKASLSELYETNIEMFAKRNVIELIKRSRSDRTDIEGTIKEYFANVSADTQNEIASAVKGG